MNAQTNWKCLYHEDTICYIPFALQPLSARHSKDNHSEIFIYYSRIIDTNILMCALTNYLIDAGSDNERLQIKAAWDKYVYMQISHEHVW